MTLTVDIAALLATDGLAELEQIDLAGAHTTYGYTGFGDADAAAFEIRIARLESESVTAVIEGSTDDGATWATVADLGELTETTTAVVANPPDAIRISLDGTADVTIVAKPLAYAKTDTRFANGVCVLTGAGAPVDYTDGTPPATGEGFAAPASLYLDTTGANAYLNIGTQAEPAWSQLAFVA